MPNDMDALYKKYRPTKLNEIVGQATVVKQLEAKIKAKAVPHALLFTGPSGVGKTTLARIVAARLGCSPSDQRNCTDINCAVEEPMAIMRDLKKGVTQPPTNGKARVWIMDEFQALSRAGFSQQAMLKIMEDIHEKSYIFLCTTDPTKIILTVRSRCTIYNLISLTNKEVAGLIDKTLEAEHDNGFTTPAVRHQIIESASGSARRALVLLEMVLGMETEKDQLKALGNPDVETQAIELARVLIDPRSTWPTVANILRHLDKEEPEKLRHIVLTYCRKIVLDGGKLAHLAFALIQEFRDNWFDSGHAGLVAACWTVKGRK